jgi:Zn finger protein HypA/HybF involved in hydrogenase expression
MAEPNDTNVHNQKLIEKTALAGNHPFAKMWKLECCECNQTYGANSCDFHIRRCPNCQGGKDGLPV